MVGLIYPGRRVVGGLVASLCVVYCMLHITLGPHPGSDHLGLTSQPLANPSPGADSGPQAPSPASAGGGRGTEDTPTAPSISCHRLLQGDTRELDTAAKVTPAGFFSSSSLIQATRDCPGFIRKRKYMSGDSVAEERAFPIAYSIVMYKSSGMAERLLRAIYRPHNVYCVHVDSKADNTTHTAMAQLAACFNNVFVVREPVAVHWAYYGVLEAELICTKLLLRHPGWRYFINLTGQEFPLKTNLEIVRILRILNGTNDISSYKKK